MPDGFDSAAYEDMGPDLLAQQPLTLERDPSIMPGWEFAFPALESRLNAERSWRYTWWAYWNELAAYYLPRRYKWVIVANNMNRGRPINDQIIDSTGTSAVRTCASGLWSGLTSPSRPWFKITVADDVQLDAQAKAWIEDTEKRIYAVFHKSNFYSTMAQAFEDVTVFGTAPVIIYEDEKDVIRCYLPCAGEYFLGAGARLSVDTLYREFTLTIAQIVEQFGLESCPQEVRTLWDAGGGSLTLERIVAHAIEPNFPVRGTQRGKETSVRIVPSIFPFREIYWLRGQKCSRPLSARGFHHRPFMASRWSTVSNDAYGRSPCMDALGDVKQIQLETLRKAEFIEKGVRPPMGASPTLKNEPASILPGHITYFDTQNGKGFFPLFEPQAQWLAALNQDIASIQARINRTLFVDVFMAITQMQGVQPRNDLELTKRDLERLQVLGPFVEMFENEFAGPAIERTYDILYRRRLLAPMPESLASVPLKIEYVSIMRMAQQDAESIAIKDFLATMGGMSAAAKAAQVPDPIRVVNLEEAARLYAKLNNVPTTVLFTPDQVEEHDQARMRAKAQEQVLPTTMAGVSAAKTLADTPIGGGSLLNSLLTGNTVPQ